MKRAGFTMIELIFVIVILGILSAVALPKFIGVSNQAHDAKVKAFVGTLNRTVGPAVWAKSIAGTGNGSITADCATLVATYVDTLPSELTDNGNCSFSAISGNGAQFGINFTDGSATIAPIWTVSTTAAGS
jgi:prepilin-type N-terminal cleavage/methylation domain-containing protein